MIFFSQKHGPQWRIFGLRNARFLTSTKNLGSAPSFPSSSVQMKCYVVENVKSSAFQVMFSLRWCLSEFLKKLFHFHKGKGVYPTSRTKRLMPTPIIRLPPFITCSNVFICPDTMWEAYQYLHVCFGGLLLYWLGFHNLIAKYFKWLGMSL